MKLNFLNPRSVPKLRGNPPYQDKKKKVYLGDNNDLLTAELICLLLIPNLSIIFFVSLQGF